jgi:uncharacterized protein (TIGR01244 family)
MDRTQVAGIYNYRLVDGRLSTAGQPTEQQLAAAASDGFQIVINLALHDNSHYSLKDEAGWVRTLGMEYFHIPVQFETPSEVDMEAFFAIMEAHKEHKVLIHCAANKRVTAFLGLYRVIKQNWSIEQAFALMRSVWEPDAIWSVFISSMLEKHRG